MESITRKKVKIHEYLKSLRKLKNNVRFTKPVEMKEFECLFTVNNLLNGLQLIEIGSEDQLLTGWR